MSIDITCYTTLDVRLLQLQLDVIKSRYDYVFNNSYVMYDANEVLTRQQVGLIVDVVEKYQKETDLLISEEFGLKDAKSRFMTSVNDKSFPTLNTSEIADVFRHELGKGFRHELGEENIIVLLNGEDLI